MFTQTDEEPIILEALKDIPNGRLLEIGAYNPTCFSNSRALIEKGWSAVLVEPSPDCFMSLLNEYRTNDRITLVNACLAAEDGFGPFYNSAGACATTHKPHAEFWEKQGGQADFRTIYMPRMNVKHIFERFGADFDFISIDTEGSDLEILSAIPSIVLQGCKLICIEYGKQLDAIGTQLQSNGFKLLHRNGENIIAGK